MEFMIGRPSLVRFQILFLSKNMLNDVVMSLSLIEHCDIENGKFQFNVFSAKSAAEPALPRTHASNGRLGRDIPVSWRGAINHSPSDAPFISLRE